MPTSNKTQKHGLGRGFSSLIPTDLLDESFDPTASQDQQVSELRNIKLDQIVADPEQPRKAFEQDAMEELAASIREHGVLQPIIVMPFEGGYQIVAGERRFRAAKLAGLDKIPALVRTLSNQHKLELSLIENLQRRDLNVMETATAYLKLRDQFNMTLEQIMNRVGVGSISAVSNKLRLLKLSKYVRNLIADGQLTEGQSKPLVGVDEEIIKIVVPKIIKENWSSRKVEQFVVDMKKNQELGETSKQKQATEKPYAKQLENIQKRLKADVAISTSSRGNGFIKIKFADEAEFERLQKILS